MEDKTYTMKEVISKIIADDEHKRDVVTDIKNLDVVKGGIIVEGKGYESTNLAEITLGERFGIPGGYFSRCSVELQKEQIKYWRGHKKGDCLVRLRGEKVRTVLSSQYQPVHNHALIKALDDAFGYTNVVFKHFRLDDHHFHLRAILPDSAIDFGEFKTEKGVQKSDPVFPMIQIHNSEVGLSGISFRAGIYRQWCTNGAVTALKEIGNFYHQHRGGLHNGELTKLVVKGIEEVKIYAENQIKKFQKSKEVEVKNPDMKLQQIGKHLNFSKKFLEEVKKYYYLELNPSMFGVINAITHAAQMYDNMQTRLQIEEQAFSLI